MTISRLVKIQGWLIVLLMGISAWGLFTSLDTRATTSNIKVAALRECQSLQVVRARANANGAVLYLALTETRKTALREHLATFTTYQNPLDCEAAVDHPLRFRPPEPQGYTMTLAMHALTAEHLVPRR